ncbi:hypothetical protein ScPMuIL_017294 [Solemya velum]
MYLIHVILTDSVDPCLGLGDTRQRCQSRLKNDGGEVEMKFSPQKCELQGIFKCNGIDHGTSNWKTGVLVVYWDAGCWRISLYNGCTVNSRPAYTFRLDPYMIKKIICKAQLVLELNDTGRSNIHFKFPANSHIPPKYLQDLHNLLLAIKNGNASPETPKGSKDNKSPPKMSPKKVPAEQQFTSVKENKKSERSSERGSKLLYDDCDDESKENQRGQANSSEMFLQRGCDKSRECLQTLATSGFYGSPSQTGQSSLFSGYGSTDKNKDFTNKTSTPSSGRLFGSFGINSSVKRTPGLMPDPTPTKKLRLLDAAQNYSSTPTYSWQKAKPTQQPDKKQQVSLQGFSNLGNTCYMNAILQALFGLDTFTSDLLVNNRKIHKQISPHSLYYSLAKLLHSRRRSASDLVRRDLLRAVKTSISTTVRRFSGYQQHDAHEFLVQVIDQLKEEVQKVCSSTPSPTRENNDWESSSSSREFLNPAIINFEFEVTHSIACLECGEVVTKCEQFNDLSLDMPKRDLLNPRSIQHALELFFKKEKIEYTCEKCGSNKSEVTHKFSKLPRVLILHLKRYNYDVVASRNTKMAQSIRIPQYLTLQSHCREETQPPQPACLPSVPMSPLKVQSDSEDQKEGTPRRKLEYKSGYHFKKMKIIGDEPDKVEEKLNDLNKDTPIELDNGDVDKEEPTLKPIVLDEEIDPELARVLEMSLKEHTEQQEKKEKVADDDEFERAMELSRQDNLNSSTVPSDPGVYDEKSLNELSEEEQMRIAIEQSLRESEIHYGYMADEHQYTQTETFDNCSEQTEYSFKSNTLNENSVQYEESLQPQEKKCGRASTPGFVDEKKAKVETDTSGINVKTESDLDSDQNLCYPKAGMKSETNELCLNKDDFEDLAQDNLENSDFVADINEKRNLDNNCLDKSEATIKNLRGTDITGSNLPDLDLLCNETDTGWMCLENKENNLPNNNKSVPPSDTKYKFVDDLTDDSDNEKDVSVVINEKGDLPYSYQLISIVNHIGSTSVAGHYICDVFDMKKKGWFSFDDSHVTSVSELDVLTKREKCGYIFFYISKDIFEEVKEHYSSAAKNKSFQIT